jgi:hypothetical protein
MEPKQTLHATATPAFAGIEVLCDRLQIGMSRFEAIRQRRRALTWLLGASALPLLGCGGGSDEAGGTDIFTRDSSGSCATIPAETADPFPGDRSNSLSGTTVNALALCGIVRSDRRSSLPASLGSAAGIPLTIRLQLVNTNASCASLAGRAVYLWHCDRNGNYSMYSNGVTAQKYLRGAQVSDRDGMVVFAASSRADMPGAGHTCTSRSSPAWPRPAAAPTTSARRSWPCLNPLAAPSMPPAATAPVCPT